MTNSMYRTLLHHTIETGTKLNRRSTNRPTNITLDDPAISVMTDFNDITPFSIEPSATINATNDKMIACGVRLLFVTDSDGNMIGLVTATDTKGEKPVQFMKEHGGKFDDILCQDIMTPADRLDALQIRDVELARVGDIVETMKLFRRQHILVTDKPEGIEDEIIRGIFSTTQIGRQLGFRIEHTGLANSFAELEQALLAS